MKKQGQPTAASPRPSGEGPAHRSSEDFVYSTLKDAIASGDLQPGERVIESQLASRLKVSRTPVRAAVRLLEDQRLLERRSGVGLVVTTLSLEQLDDIYTTRSVLMGLAARLAAQRRTPGELVKIQVLQEEYEALTETDSYRQMAIVNDRFHEEIVNAARSESLNSLLGQIHHSIIRFRYTTHLVPGRAQESIDEHRRLVAAIIESNGAEAEHISREHVMNAHLARLRQQAEREMEAYKTVAAEP